MKDLIEVLTKLNQSFNDTSIELTTEEVALDELLHEYVLNSLRSQELPTDTREFVAKLDSEGAL